MCRCIWTPYRICNCEEVQAAGYTDDLLISELQQDIIMQQVDYDKVWCFETVGENIYKCIINGRENFMCKTCFRRGKGNPHKTQAYRKQKLHISAMETKSTRCIFCVKPMLTVSWSSYFWPHCRINCFIHGKTLHKEGEIQVTLPQRDNRLRKNW